MGSGDEGYAFILPIEFDPSCPLFVAPRDLTDRGGDVSPAHRFTVRGVFHSADRVIAGGVGPDERKEVVDVVDVDGDGRADHVVRLSRHGRDGAIILRRHTAAGWSGEDVVERDDHDHHGQDYEGIVRAGGAVLLRSSYWSAGSLAFICAGERAAGFADDSGAWQFQRWVGDRLRVVLDVAPPPGEGVDWHGESDGSLVAIGSESHRTQRFRWNADRARYEVEGATLTAVTEPIDCRPIRW